MPASKTLKRAVKSKTVGKKLKAASDRASKEPVQSKADFASVFSALKAVMAEYADQLHVATDEPQRYYLVTKSQSWKGGPMYFGAVIWGKAYVSYHLMPLYVCPELVKEIPPELKRRMQGKSCFNFRDLDEALFAELGNLTKSGVAHYRGKKFL